jgi:2-polyprenyl-3-methyl-5-hydroxy-6-metoxy-1,4-benzoquinol methylase
MNSRRLQIPARLKRLLTGRSLSRTPDHSLSDPNFIGFDKYREHGAYHWRELERNPEYRAKIQLLEALIKDTDACLDLGCGDGAYVYSLSKRCAEVVGVDADTHAARLASDQLARAKVANARCLNLVLSQVNRESVGRETFDVVYSMDVIEHLPEPLEVLDVACRMVRPGGIIATGTPLYLGDHLVSEYHVKEYTREEFEQLVSSRIELDRVEILRDRRLDGKMYEESFIVGIGRPLAA